MLTLHDGILILKLRDNKEFNAMKDIKEVKDPDLKSMSATKSANERQGFLASYPIRILIFEIPLSLSDLPRI